MYQPQTPQSTRRQLTEDQKEKAKQGLWAIVYTVGVMPLDAFMVWLLWGFFVTPLGLPALSYWWAFGIDIFVSYMQSTSGASMGMVLINAHFKVPLDARMIVKQHLGVVVMTLVLAIAMRLLMR